MNGHNITNESLALSMVLVLIAILVSYREKLAPGKRYYLEYLPGDRAADYRRLCAEIYL
ncbi:hypothetical protein LNP17_07500 [Klebsiella variicola subsp. variicola]|nr:hypothetical protein [Klebsiella variicola subsp. variicola]